MQARSRSLRAVTTSCYIPWRLQLSVELNSGTSAYSTPCTSVGQALLFGGQILWLLTAHIWLLRPVMHVLSCSQYHGSLIQYIIGAFGTKLAMDSIPCIHILYMWGLVNRNTGMVVYLHPPLRTRHGVQKYATPRGMNPLDPTLI